MDVRQNYCFTKLFHQRTEYMVFTYRFIDSFLASFNTFLCLFYKIIIKEDIMNRLIVQLSVKVNAWMTQINTEQI